MDVLLIGYEYALKIVGFETGEAQAVTKTIDDMDLLSSDYVN